MILNLDYAAIATLIESAYTDELTGCESRRGYADRRQADNGDRCLILVDIRGLKQINDLHGQVAGDAYLRESVAALRSLCRRENDGVCRMGGDEFLLDVAAVDASIIASIDRKRWYVGYAITANSGYEGAYAEAANLMVADKKKRKGWRGWLRKLLA